MLISSKGKTSAGGRGEKGRGEVVLRIVGPKKRAKQHEEEGKSRGSGKS